MYPDLTVACYNFLKYFSKYYKDGVIIFFHFISEKNDKKNDRLKNIFRCIL